MRPFESGKVAEIVGIRPIYLNKFVERKLYGIEPSAQRGTGKGTRRWFNLDDLFGIALVWWLFEAGLRAEVIKRVLRGLGNTSKADAYSAAKRLRESGAEYLVVRRGIRSAASKDKWPPQQVSFASVREVSDCLKQSDKESLHVLPVGRLLASVSSQLKKYG